MKFFISALFCLMLVTACASHKTEVVNPYQQQAEHYLASGVQAMNKQHKHMAEKRFLLALEQATLADDTSLRCHALYNLAMLQRAQQRYTEAEQGFLQVIQEAHYAQLSKMFMRAQWGRLLNEYEGKLSPMAPNFKTLYEQFFVSHDWPSDLVLLAADVASLEKDKSIAKKLYMTIIVNKPKASDEAYEYAKAYLGLARLSLSKQASSNYAQQCIELAHRFGFPHLNAHALYQQAAYSSDSLAIRQQKRQRALLIYLQLGDAKGVQRCKDLSLP